ncbi:conserved hypothetical protein [Ricinus communis]|uniref:Uncharacterized protein n=1 Tax=Ricinus communis TaxID=3988 RepID=B9SVA4_RICCO|nr:conserved hypothetical protein [Ricinus communis]
MVSICRVFSVPCNDDRQASLLYQRALSGKEGAGRGEKIKKGLRRQEKQESGRH